MQVRARLMDDKGRTFGYTSVDEKAQAIQWGGSMFIYDATSERATEAGRRVQRTFRQVNTDIEVIVNLDEEF